MVVLEKYEGVLGERIYQISQIHATKQRISFDKNTPPALIRQSVGVNIIPLSTRYAVPEDKWLLLHFTGYENFLFQNGTELNSPLMQDLMI